MHEQESVHHFKNALKRDKNMTPEAFFRECDVMYQKEIKTTDIVAKCKQANLGLDEKTLHYLTNIMDENFSGVITMYEYYFTLQTFNATVEIQSPLKSDPNFVPFLDKAVIKLVGSMRDREMSADELFNMIDTSNDEKVSLQEMIEVVKFLKDFKKKELIMLHNMLDVDGNGEVDKKEWKQVMRTMDRIYEKHLAKQ